jgi:HEAT repeat protein
MKDRIMRFCHRVVVVAITALVALGCSSTQPPSTASQSGLFTLDELLGRMPARDSLEARWLSASLVQRGEAGIVEICKRLGPMGTEGNADAEDALQLLATHVTRPGGEADRRMFVSAIGKSLEQPRGEREAAFLLARLQVAGRGESVPAISRFLKDESLCEPAAQTLVAVREGADAPLISALTGASRENRITILRALGALRSKASVEEVTKEAASADPAIRREALAALAEVGDPASEELLTSAVQSSPEGERDIASWNLLRYAERRAEAGDAASAARIARALGGAPGQPGHIRAAALDVLAGVEADAALPDLLKALDDPERSVRVAALRTSGQLKGTAITAALAGKLKTASPDLKADLLVALGRRGDRSAEGAILESLNDTSLSVRQSAIEGAGGLMGV